MRIEGKTIYADEGKKLVRIDGLDMGDVIFLGDTDLKGHEGEDVPDNYREELIN